MKKFKTIELLWKSFFLNHRKYLIFKISLEFQSATEKVKRAESSTISYPHELQPSRRCIFFLWVRGTNYFIMAFHHSRRYPPTTPLQRKEREKGRTMAEKANRLLVTWTANREGMQKPAHLWAAIKRGRSGGRITEEMLRRLQRPMTHRSGGGS